jgi:hypothetical protein
MKRFTIALLLFVAPAGCDLAFRFCPPAKSPVVTAAAEAPAPRSESAKIDLPLEIKIEVPEVPAKIREPSPPIAKKAK